MQIKFTATKQANVTTVTYSRMSNPEFRLLEEFATYPLTSQIFNPQYISSDFILSDEEAV